MTRQPRSVDAQRLGGLEVEDELKLGCLHRRVGVSAAASSSSGDESFDSRCTDVGYGVTCPKRERLLSSWQRRQQALPPITTARWPRPNPAVQWSMSVAHI